MDKLEEPESSIPYRKHSSGDLHSRLKTRKILGVGETDNGDIHRSKISQVLGHNEHLYIKFPKYFWMWYIALASLFTTLGILNAIFPKTWFELTVGVVGELDLQSEYVTRLYGSSILAVSSFMWTFWGTTDRAVARGILVSIGVVFSVQIVVLMIRFWQIPETGRITCFLFILLQGGIIATNAFFYRTVGSSTSGIRKSMSLKDLRDVHRPSDANASMLPAPASPKKFD